MASTQRSTRHRVFDVSGGFVRCIKQRTGVAPQLLSLIARSVLLFHQARAILHHLDPVNGARIRERVFCNKRHDAIFASYTIPIASISAKEKVGFGDLDDFDLTNAKRLLRGLSPEGGKSGGIREKS